MLLKNFATLNLEIQEQWHQNNHCKNRLLKKIMSNEKQLKLFSPPSEIIEIIAVIADSWSTKDVTNRQTELFNLS